MPTYPHPGVYLEEVSSGSRPIESVSTSIAAFIGWTTKGPVNEAQLIHKWGDYEDLYGGVLSETDDMGLAVSAYYINGGRSAYVARLASDANAANLYANKIPGKTGDPTDNPNVLAVTAKSKGVWGDKVHVQVTNSGEFSFSFSVGFMVDETVGGQLTTRFRAEETFAGVNMDETSPEYVKTVVNASSRYVKLDLGASIAAAPVDYFTNGVSESGELNQTDIDTVKGGMELTLNIDGLGARTVTLDAPATPPFDATTLCAQLLKQIILLGPDDAYKFFTVTPVDIPVDIPAEGNTPASTKLTLTSGTKGPSSAVVVRPGPLATMLKLGKGAGGEEIHGTKAVVPADMLSPQPLGGGDDGDPPVFDDYRRFFDKLKKIRDVSIIVLPGKSMAADGTNNSIIDLAISHCEDTKSRMVIVDLPQDVPAQKVQNLGLTTSSYAVHYYPWVKVANPFYNMDKKPSAPRILLLAPSGFAAGMWGKIDSSRGVWKAPAGIETQLRGAAGTESIVEDGEQDQLNPLGINCLRNIPGYGLVIWGARTASTRADPEWRYVPVRRTAIMIERSIYDSIQWAVFEPNDENLWSSLRLNIESFMNGLFRNGAFQGGKASDAYFVRCGLGGTMTQDDIDRGQVIVLVGFAPLKPAEFVIVRIQQKVGNQ